AARARDGDAGGDELELGSHADALGVGEPAIGRAGRLGVEPAERLVSDRHSPPEIDDRLEHRLHAPLPDDVAHELTERELDLCARLPVEVARELSEHRTVSAMTAMSTPLTR